MIEVHLSSSLASSDGRLGCNKAIKERAVALPGLWVVLGKRSEDLSPALWRSLGQKEAIAYRTGKSILGDGIERGLVIRAGDFLLQFVKFWSEIARIGTEAREHELIYGFEDIAQQVPRFFKLPRTIALACDQQQCQEDQCKSLQHSPPPVAYWLR